MPSNIWIRYFKKGCFYWNNHSSLSYNHHSQQLAMFHFLLDHINIIPLKNMEHKKLLEHVALVTTIHTTYYIKKQIKTSKLKSENIKTDISIKKNPNMQDGAWYHT